MRQAVWTGSISFGLVSIPVKLYPATEPKDVRFHLYDRTSGKRVRYERVTREDEAPVFAPDVPRSGDAPGGDDDVDEDAERSNTGASERAVSAADVVRGFQMPSGDLVT